MSQDTWKEFEDNAITHSAAHYLMTIHELLETHGYARVTDVAKSLNITRGSCSLSLKPLKKRELVLEDENKFLKLSDEGLRLAQLVEKNDELLQEFFRDVLQVDADQAEIDACKIEHLLSITTSMKLASFMKLINSGDLTSKNFLKKLQQQDEVCAHDVEKCDHCDTVCLVNTDT